jgi:hypothetical protein
MPAEVVPTTEGKEAAQFVGAAKEREGPNGEAREPGSHDNYDS